MTNENDQPTAADGLVISDKTDRDSEFHHHFPTPQQIKTASEHIPALVAADPAQTHRHYVSLSPGQVRVSKQDKHPNPYRPNYTPRKPITEWSKKSRANMVAVLSSLDYNPMFDGGKIPALITLTYPANFRTLCPDAATGTRHLKLFRQRYERKYGKALAVYKWEFMKSGSPHVHLFMVPPSDPGFKAWLSETWADIVGETDPIERAKHERAGTAVDYATGARSSDPKRVAVYFSKHASPNQGSKEYQNRAPHFWREAGSVGRFWGRWGLKTATTTVEITEADAVFIARVLRRWARANSRPRKVMVWRVNQKTGVVSKRFVNRRPKRQPGTQGFTVVNDGTSMGEFLASALRAHFLQE